MTISTELQLSLVLRWAHRKVRGSGINTECLLSVAISAELQLSLVLRWAHRKVRVGRQH